MTSAIATNIQGLRKRAGMSQAYLAQAVGVRQATVSGWEQGVEPESANIAVLCELFGVTDTDLRSADLLARKAPWADPSAPASIEEAARRVRAIAARLEGDLHEWGADEPEFEAVRAALATEATVQLVRDESLSADDLAIVFGNYMRFVDAFRQTLGDRIVTGRLSASPREIRPDQPLEKLPRRTTPATRAHDADR